MSDTGPHAIDYDLYLAVKAARLAALEECAAICEEFLTGGAITLALREIRALIKAEEGKG